MHACRVACCMLRARTRPWQRPLPPLFPLPPNAAPAGGSCCRSTRASRWRRRKRCLTSRRTACARHVAGGRIGGEGGCMMGSHTPMAGGTYLNAGAHRQCRARTWGCRQAGRQAGRHAHRRRASPTRAVARAAQAINPSLRSPPAPAVHAVHAVHAVQAIVATNIAETSLTIDGVRFVADRSVGAAICLQEAAMSDGCHARLIPGSACCPGWL